MTTFHYDRQRTGWNNSETRVGRPANDFQLAQFGSSVEYAAPGLPMVYDWHHNLPPHLYALSLYVDKVSINAGSLYGSAIQRRL